MVDASGTVIGVLGIARDVTERNRAEQALKESEERVQRKLRAVVEPGGDLGALGMRDILDVSTLQALMEDVSALTGMVTAILDLEGNILIATGWQDICTQFHRACPGTAAHCTKSDLFLVKHVKQGEYVEYRCENGLWDVVTPLYVEDRHLGNIYTGQFFYDSDEVDEAFFIDLAACYGFEAAPYLDALRRVPRLTRTQVARHMDYLVRITRFISRLSIANLRLARATAELRRSEEEKALLYSELQHRVKNSLALVSSVLRLNLGDVAEDGPRGILQEAAHRVRCVSMAYDQLTQPSRVGNVRLDAYLAGLAELLHKTYAPRPEDVRLDVTLGAVECPQKQAISVGLIFNELFTNALKYGCEASRRATIAITLSCEGGTVALRIADDGRGLPAGLVPTTAKSLGLRIVHLLAAELGGDVEFAQTAGTTAQLRFPRP